MLLNGLFVGKQARCKVARIGYAIVRVVQPGAVIAPLQVGLGVQLHHLYQSKFLVDTLHEMGIQFFLQRSRAF